MRYHTCYGINEGPRIFDMALKDIVGLMLKVKARPFHSRRQMRATSTSGTYGKTSSFPTARLSFTE